MTYKILITGGTGSIGRELAKHLTGCEVTIFSRNEKSQVLMKQECPEYNYIIGDIRDEREIEQACIGKDYVFHFAALKHVDKCQIQPQEAMKTNVLGTLNVIHACNNGCKLVNMSSDKAISPANVYGMTKAIAEAMVTQAHHANIRSGNVLWSSGSVLHLWKTQLEKDNSIQLTAKEMTRFFIHPTELALFIIDHKDMIGTFTVPMKSFRLYDIAEEFIHRYGNKSSHIVFTDLRPGERLHEFRAEGMSSKDHICTDLNYIFDGKPV